MGRIYLCTQMERAEACKPLFGLFQLIGFKFKRIGGGINGRGGLLGLDQGPIDRRYGLAKLTVHTAGNHNSTVVLPGLAHTDALAMREAIRAAIRQDVL